METKHTPGPWEYRSSTDSCCPFVLVAPHPFIPDARRTLAINLSPASHGENDANARLIAAAPELLDALKVIKACSTGLSNGTEHARLTDIAQLAKAAIIKAEGK